MRLKVIFRKTHSKSKNRLMGSQHFCSFLWVSESQKSAGFPRLRKNLVKNLSKFCKILNKFKTNKRPISLILSKLCDLRSQFQFKFRGNWSNSEKSQNSQNSKISKKFWKRGSVQISVQNLRPHAATRKMGSTFRKTKNIFIEWDWRSFLEKHTALSKIGLWEVNFFVHF